MSVTISPTALTTLASVKLAMRIPSATTTYDDVLTQFINQISAAIETFCDRKFLAVPRVEWYDLNSQRVLNLKAFPLQSINMIAWGWANCLTSVYAGTNLSVTVQADTDRVRYVCVSNVGVSVAHEFLYATYPTTNLLAAAINAAAFGVTATANTNVNSAWITPQAGVSISGGQYALTYPDTNYVEYVPDFDTGQLSLKWSGWNMWNDGGGYGVANGSGGFTTQQTSYNGPGASLNMRLGSGRKVLMVDYTGGYVTIPDDIVWIANQCVQTAFYASAQDPTIDYKKVGDGAYKLSAVMTNPSLTTQQMDYLTGAYRNIPIGDLV